MRLTTDQTRSYARAAARAEVGIIGRNLWTQDEISTTDDTVTTIATILTSEDSGGIIYAMCLGVDESQNIYSVIKQVRYQNTLGTVTLFTITEAMAEEVDAALIGSDFTFTASAENVLLEVTGIAATNINWGVKYITMEILNTIPPP